MMGIMAIEDKTVFFREFILCVVFSVFCSMSCGRKVESIEMDGMGMNTIRQNWPVLEFSMTINRHNWEHTDFGEPPQLAIWLERPDSGWVRTVSVSHRTGRNQWKGKVECPTALPYWKSRHRIEKSGFRERTRLRRLADAISGATPRENFSTQIRVPPESQWEYYIEVNVSGDFNAAFPSMTERGMPDTDGNGQPSLVYRGEIVAEPHSADTPALIGRTEQWSAVDSVITDMVGIDSAVHILQDVKVTCLQH